MHSALTSAGHWVIIGPETPVFFKLDSEENTCDS